MKTHIPQNPASVEYGFVYDAKTSVLYSLKPKYSRAFR